MYQMAPTTTVQDISAFGMPAGMLGCVVEEPEAVNVWPDHAMAVDLFDAVSTQWRVGFNGATGLDYGALPAVFDLYQVPEGERRDRFAELRVMEDEALKAIHEAKK